MERGLDRFIAGLFMGAFVLMGAAQAQQAGSFIPIDQLTASMLGEAEAAEEVDPTEAKPFLNILEGIQANGTVNIGYTYNFNDSESGNNTGPENPGRIFDIFHNEFTVHNAVLNLEKPVDNDNLIGFVFTPTVGKDSSSTQGGNISFPGDDLDVLQLAVKIYTPDDIAILGGTVWEVGKFGTNVGMEVIPAGYNDMFSRTWLFGLAQPYTHTGVRATKTVLTREDEESLVDFSFGIANGWDNHFVGSNNGAGVSNGNFPTFMNTLFLTPGGEMEPSFTASWLIGETTQTGKVRNLVDLVGSIKVVPDLTLSANFDWIGDDAGNATTGGWGELWGFAGILRYDFSVMEEEKKWYAAFRGEYVDDSDGFAFGGADNRPFELTWSIGYKPVSSLLLRTEVRYDKADQKVFESGTENHQTTLSFDVSLLF